MVLSWTMDKIGPLCRSAGDCGLVLQVISGVDSEDPSSAGKSFYYAPQFVRKFAELTIGFAPVDFEQWVEPACRGAMQQAIEVLRASGLRVREARLPDFPYAAVAGTIIAAEGAAVFEPLIADQKQIAGLKAGLEIPAKDYLRAMRIRGLIQRELRKLLTGIDVLVAPTLSGTAPKISEPLDGPRRDRPRPKDRGFRDLGAAGNLAGLPALSLPCGFAEGLPVAIQLVGRPFAENTLLAIGKQFQSRTDWHRRRPPMS
jgi:aspartyl-tRNA(Asn)/glutamyl-tRNA(Gln) amidotransferase subunit A